MQLEPKPLKYQQLDGISAKQLAEHHDKLYTGYVNKYNEIIGQIKDVDWASANQTYSDARELNVEKSFALNGVKLHEGYFDGLTDKSGGGPDGVIKTLLEQHFGSVDAWTAQFKALGMAARGWVVLAWDYDRKVLENYICDAHNQGGVWNTAAIIILDVYEHAYFIDFATARKDYIERYMAALDWAAINDRLHKLGIT